LWALYRLSDVASFAIFHVFRYRRDVVLKNLEASFPEKSPQERDRIARAFFSHLGDLIVESIKGSTMSKAEIGRRHRYTNIELLDAYYAKGKSVSILGAHFGNWEWVALSLPLATRFKTYGIFQKLNNRFFNDVIKKSRERHGMGLIATSEVSKVLGETRDQRITMGYIGDQSPGRSARHHIVDFLNQKTAASYGYERFAREYDTPVVYLNIVKVRRGYYEGTFYPVTDVPRQTKDGEIADAFMSKLEAIIKEQPEFWLWSHRRWKLTRTL
jgi:KDO2-lipid IV(A) lauroyltransferase